ncbi:hypothetical protein M378DRAFT_170151 [Amanita muscaria Koide BX008]|uniref:Opi1-domain-containing protein n=1 Tax=Amanita muscaria (strain Koide BX008) TaxID=946122 RepID=A0A0C2WBU1_AMAMK|nr:hypothetical protein M378DRAFT_170151 [Amanita muscaria Koide BX008]
MPPTTLHPVPSTIVPSSSSSSSSSPPSPPPSDSASTSSHSLVTRVSHLPLVNSVLRTYEQGKASSRVVKYGAEMMESSVRSISRPVIDRLPVNVNQLDEFACRQLDRLDRYRRCSIASPPAERPSSSPPKLRTTKTLDGSLEEEKPPDWHHHSVPPDSRSSTPTQVEPDENSSNADVSHQAQTQVVAAQRSRWQAVLLEAGGLGAALSDENMRRLKYCLHCLQYATAQIDAQILILRDFITSFHPAATSSRHPSESSRRPPVSHAHMRTLTDVRRDLVHTIRQVVDVVSKYAGGALPEPARTRVRGFILKLPQRWASRAGVSVTAEIGSACGEEGGTAAASGSGGAVRRTNRRAQYRERGPNSDSRTSSRAPSPSSPRVQPVSAGAAVVAAQRILTLATESLDMMRGVTGVMKDSLDRADAWVNRLRTVGIQRDAIPEEDERFDLPPPHALGSDEEEFYSFRSGLPSPAMSAGSSTAYSSTYNVAVAGLTPVGEGSAPSTPGIGGFTGSPSVLPIVPLGRMSLRGKEKVGCDYGCEEMDVDGE